MGRILIAAAATLLLAGCSTSTGAGRAATPQARAASPAPSHSPSATPSHLASPTPRPSTVVPPSFPLAAGWGRGGGDGRPHLSTHPLALDVRDIRPYVPTGAVARRTMVFDQPEWDRAREVDVFASPTAARTMVSRVIRLARADARSRSEDGSTYLREVQLRAGGIVVVVTWRELGGRPALATSSLVLHRSGRAVLISTDSEEGLGRRAALRLAATDLTDLAPAVAALDRLA